MQHYRVLLRVKSNLNDIIFAIYKTKRYRSMLETFAKDAPVARSVSRSSYIENILHFICAVLRSTPAFRGHAVTFVDT